MRYLWLILFSIFILGCIFFSMHNAELVTLHFEFGPFGAYNAKRPLFIPIFVSLALGILFCVGYFFVYHSQLILQIKWQAREIKRLKRLVLLERKNHDEMGQRHKDIEQIAERLQNQIDHGIGTELPLMPVENSTLTVQRVSSTPSDEKQDLSNKDQIEDEES